MSVSAHDIVSAALDAAIEELKNQGMEAEVKRLPRIVSDVLREKGELVTATLVTPAGNAGPAREAVQSALEKKFGGSVTLTERADPTLVGGAVLLIGDLRIDMSVKGALEEMVSSLRHPLAAT